MTLDPDQPDPRLIRELVRQYEAAATRLRDQVISPAGKTDKSRQWNQARAAQVLSQVDAEIQRLKATATRWTGPALTRSMRRGAAVADKQARDAGITGTADGVSGSFALVNRDVATILARDTVGDLHGAAESMHSQARTVLRRMAATGVTNAQVNTILTGGSIEGQPTRAVRELREALRKVHGKKVTILDKNGDARTFDAGYYASMVATTKMREATVKARHARLQDKGVDLVEVIGSTSKNFCTAYLHKVYSISGSHDRYPPLADLPGGGPPFHPNCSKATTAFIEALADPEQVEAADPDPDTDKLHRVEDRTELQKRFQALQLHQQALQRAQALQAAQQARADSVNPAPIASFDEQKAKWNKSLSADEKAIFRGWSDTEFRSIRKYEAGLITNDFGRERMREKTAIFNAALDRAPNYQGIVYRGLVSRNPAQYTRVGSIVTFNATSSTSKSKRIATEFIQAGVGGRDDNRIMLEIVSKTGKDISGVVMSDYKREKEVVLRRGVKLKVVSVDQRDLGGMKVTFVKMEEL